MKTAEVDKLCLAVWLRVFQAHVEAPGDATSSPFHFVERANRIATEAEHALRKRLGDSRGGLSAG